MSNAFFGQKPSESPRVSFEKSFGDMQLSEDQYGNESKLYYDPWMKVDERQAIAKGMLTKSFEMMQKDPSVSTTTGGAGTAGYALVPVYVDPSVVDRTRRLTPLRELIPRRAMRGLTYDYNFLSAKGGAAFNYEDAAMATQDDTYDRASVSVKYMYAVGRVTGPSIAAMRGFIDPLQLDLGVKSQSLLELEEDTIINGDDSTNPEEFDGLINIITTNVTAVGGAVALADIRAQIATTFNANGLVTLGVTDATTHNAIKDLLMDFQRSVAPPAQNIPFGIPDAFNFDGVDFIKDRYMPTTSGSRRILFLDMRYIFMAVLQDMTYEELAKTNDSQKYMMKMYETLVCTFEASCSQLTTIS